MSILGKNLHKVLSLLIKKDAGCHVYTDSVNLNIVGSIDGLSNDRLLEWNQFKDKEIDTLGDLGFQYDIKESTWYVSLHNLGRNRRIEDKPSERVFENDGE